MEKLDFSMEKFQLSGREDAFKLFSVIEQSKAGEVLLLKECET